MKIITLLTDFGLSDPYVAAMKGVLLGLCPDASIVDISHSIQPHNLDEAAFILNGVYRYFPKGTIHVIVVDPGVGTDRAVLAVDTSEYFFLAPDNGVLKYVLRDSPKARVFRVTNRELFLKQVSNTFHGRDVFAPVAAHLASGHPIESVGESCSDYVRGKIINPIMKEKSISGEIIYIDGFGNGITNINQDMLTGRKNIRISIGDQTIQNLVTSYSEVDIGTALAIIGSFGMLEIAVRERNAQKILDFQSGDSVQVNWD
ncbi:S-adenosyl-l-methionine hydroxide adenosyltransferase family protein [bacterium]